MWRSTVNFGLAARVVVQVAPGVRPVDWRQNRPATLQKATDTVKAEAIADVILHVRVTQPKRFTPADLDLLSKGYTLKIFTSLPNFDAELTDFTKLIDDDRS